MSWSLYETGTPDGVAKAIAESSVYSNVTGEATKKLVAAICAEIPEDRKPFTFVSVEASGHDEIKASRSGMNAHAFGSATIKISVGKMQA